ncbi:MAG TPA: class I SAM-dependent methyltransferase [Bacillales bacterium]|nr:class I SAM-dependent methyltransferase [Bacillales bacterium]
MDYKKYTEANRQAWNEVSPKHEEIKREAKKQFLEPGFSCLDETVTTQLQQIGLKGKHVAQICCNDGVETLSLKNLGAASATGFDISDGAIEAARRLADEAKVDCNFVRTDIYEISDEYNGQFDLAYISVGALSWFPDLESFFQVVRRVLKPGGIMVIYEMHPFLNMLEEEDHTFRIRHSYFREEPWAYDDGITYMGNESYESSTAYNFDQKLSDIIGGALHNGFQLKAFREFPHDLSGMFEQMEDRKIQVPLSFMLVAQT